MARESRHSAEARRWQATGVGSLLGLGLLGLLLYTGAGPHPMSALGAGLMISCATAVSGGVLGFLFGIPHASGSGGSGATGSGTTASGATGADPTTAAADTTPNTNLEQVSDWLTKILLGVGLTQLSSIWAHLRQLARALAPALGGRSDSAPFAAALVVYFVLLGFLGGWLLTRLMLAGALSRADGNALRLFAQAQQQQREGNTVGAEDSRVQAMGHLGQFSSQAAPAASGQPAAMASQVAEVRAAAKTSPATAEEVRGLFASDDPGLRMQALALTEGNALLGDFESVLDYVEHPRSAFEHYHALLAARGLIPTLGREQLVRLRAAVVSQLLAPDGLPDASDRRWVGERILAVLDSLGQPPAQPPTNPPTQLPAPRPSGG
ncbi:hypothetical protein P3T36_006794 [Kitasatospora sp. MAP12-15]|uniref:hypothetical protein n=1 Tax=unclassified Kitasatospora TaxID=2633591 RepID=UPI0024764CDD|nr:hypothetical protein [Kitasatospora sp. MAP12-44]MDH6112180.1 hypothetical protein [Kitasatospora sp. MAP12-44]